MLPKIPTVRAVVDRLRLAVGLPVLQNTRLASLERVFLAPPLTPELVAAIRLISPHCHLSTNDADRELWERDQNGACWNEYEALLPLFRAMPSPQKVLEIGCGLGRSLVFFNKKLTKGSGEFHAYDADGRTTHYTMLGKRGIDSFCGNLPMLRYVLDYNNVGNVRTFDAMEVPLAALPGPYDLIYSFYSVGFHWALQHFLPDLLPLMHDRTIAVFTIPLEFVPFPELDRFSIASLVSRRSYLAMAVFSCWW